MPTSPLPLSPCQARKEQRSTALPPPAPASHTRQPPTHAMPPSQCPWQPFPPPPSAALPPPRLLPLQREVGQEEVDGCAEGQRVLVALAPRAPPRLKHHAAQPGVRLLGGDLQGGGGNGAVCVFVCGVGGDGERDNGRRVGDGCTGQGVGLGVGLGRVEARCTLGRGRRSMTHLGVSSHAPPPFRTTGQGGMEPHPCCCVPSGGRRRLTADVP